MLVEASQFIGEIAIPNDQRDVNHDLLCQYISKYEPEWLRNALGVAFSDEFGTALAGSPADKWVLLRDGGNFTYNDKTYYFSGVRKLIQQYVYFYFIRGTFSVTTLISEKKSDSEHAKSVSPFAKTQLQWAQMVEGMITMYDLLDNGDYPTFDLCDVKPYKYWSLPNTLGI